VPQIGHALIPVEQGQKRETSTQTYPEIRRRGGEEQGQGEVDYPHSAAPDYEQPYTRETADPCQNASEAS